MSETVEATGPSPRELAAAIVALNIQEQEAGVARAQAQAQMLSVQLAAARLRAPFEVARLARDMEAAVQP
jgi:hypothetical protein